MELTAPAAPPLREPGRRRVMAICNQKGGVGKTTSTVNLAANLASMGRHTRMHDMDPQGGSLTVWLPPQWDDVPPLERYDMSHVLNGECTLDQATWPTPVPNLYVVPSFQTLTGWANARPVGAESAFKVAVEESQFDCEELLDCAPSLGLLTIAALAAADDLVVPLRASILDLAGVAELNETIALVQKRVNDLLKVVAVLLCGKLESKLTGQVIEQLKLDYPGVITEQIRNTVRVQEAPAEELPINLFAPGCTADVDYQRVTGLLFPSVVEEFQRSTGKRYPLAVDA